MDLVKEAQFCIVDKNRRKLDELKQNELQSNYIKREFRIIK